MLVVRPIAVGVATAGLPLNRPQKLFLGWLAPRGIVTASVASLFAIRLEQAGILGAGRLQGLVFLTILMTVGLQGLTAQPLARALGLIEESCEATTPSGETTLQPGEVLPDPGQ
jgi:NhaP-type Na+/H+ or K+/H+ antiporter